MADKLGQFNFSQETFGGISKYSFDPGEPRDRQLDTLARLLVGDEICTVVCHHENKLLIASNKKEPEYAKEYLKNLQVFAIKQSHENCKRLLELVVEKTSTKKEGKKKITQPVKDIFEKKDKPKTFRKLIEEYQKKSDKPINFGDLQEAAQKTFNKVIRLNGDSKTKTEANQKWSYLIKWQDTGEIIEAIIRENLDKQTLEKIKNTHLEDDIIYIISEGGF